MNRIEIQVPRADLFMALAGNLDCHFKYIEEKLKVSLTISKDTLILKGQDAGIAQEVIGFLLKCLGEDEAIDAQKIDYAIECRDRDVDALLGLYTKQVMITHDGRSITPKTFGQDTYLNTIACKDLIFGLGPAGTGKTFLAVAMAIKALKNKQVKKIIVTRPALEAGENLGYLPGGLETKIEPYLKPVYDSMIDILGRETFLNYRERGWIEIAPLAYMRGRTLDHAFIILDEAQNTTCGQMKMFLTRFGHGSKVIINGDISQQDLMGTSVSGLSHAIDRLGHLEEIGIVELHKKDVVRHGLVKKIIECYDTYKE